MYACVCQYVSMCVFVCACVLYSHKHLNHNRDTNTFTNEHIGKYKTQAETGRFRCSDTNVLLTSNFSSSSRTERQFLKLFRNHTKRTTSFNGRNPTLCPNGRNSTIVFHGPTPISQHHCRTPTSNCLPQWQTAQLTAYIVQSQLPTDSFSKSSNSQDHRFQA